MSADAKTSFLTFYIQSLGERTREERRGTKFGFDWIIYNLGLSEGWTPHRLPFLRSGPDETSTTKTEPEFGVDLAFLSQDRKKLRIFALKDEVLNNRNWGNHSFDIDLRNASTPDLSGAELADVESVEVILAYNKDEDDTGVRLFENLTKGLGTTVGDDVRLSFGRWNLTTIVEKVENHLLTPALLPQKFFSHFSYICAQFADFRHGSDEWTNQLIPNWRRFLEELLSEKADERCVRLLPVALLILRVHGEGNPTNETALIDLTEWGMLAAWEIARTTDKKPVAKAVANIWVSFYLTELERYYDTHSADLAVRFSLDKPSSGGFIDAVASAVLAHWHVARIGVLGISYAESLPAATDEDKHSRTEALVTVSNWLIGLLNGNPSALRPIIDLHQIELFLTWGTLMQVGREQDVFGWLTLLVNRLTMRRSGLGQLPFIEGHNSVDLAFEFAATGERPHEFCDSSSVYLMCLLELICMLPPDPRDALLESTYRRLVLALTDEGEQMRDCKPIDLMSWIPPNDWGDRVLKKSLADEGECATIHFGKLGGEGPKSGSEIVAEINVLVSETRSKRAFKYPSGLPLSVIVLGCLKHRSPLPPELWRRSIFGKPDGDEDGNGVSTNATSNKVDAAELASDSDEGE
ncbi:MAG: hypothetical protein KDA91_11135 [Planctomycetaceae bacterium]|nr:hypothetical protein [Planctomycetaceae bacterium]